jgi:hypothetical protein
MLSHTCCFGASECTRVTRQSVIRVSSGLEYVLLFYSAPLGTTELTVNASADVDTQNCH